MEDYMDIKEVDLMYRLVYGGYREFFPSHAYRDATLKQLETIFSCSSKGYRKFLKREKKKFYRMTPCLQGTYKKYSGLFSKRILKAAPYFDAHKSIYNHMKRYFKNDELRISFTFQAKYLSMAPWEYPAYSVSFHILNMMAAYGTQSAD